MAMVRRGVMLSLREASCCKVEVVNGSDGERCLSVRLMFVTVKDLSPMSAMMRPPARGGRLDLFTVLAVIVCLKGLVRRLVGEVGVKCPVFLRLEGLNFLFAVVDHAHSDGLHAARGEAAADLLPQKRAQLIAHDAVEYAARLLRVDQVLVDGARLLDALGDDLFVISLKVTRLAFSSSRFKSAFKCHEMASPSRSGSVARYTVSLLLAAF